MNDGDMESENENLGLVYIKGKINDEGVNILIDTGSEASMIKGELIKKCGLENNIIKVPKLTLINAKGRKICDINTSVAAEIKFDKEEMGTQLLVIENLNYEVIIGTDELHRNKVVIDYQEKRVKIKEEEIEFVECRQEGSYEEKLETKPYEEAKISKNCNMKIRNEEIYENLNNIDCKEEYREEVKRIIEKYRGLIVKENRIAKNYVHKLEVKDIENFKAKNYPVPYKYKQQVNEEIQEMLRGGIIEHSNTHYINPLVIVRKNNGELRLCLDARNMNKCTVPQYEAPLSIDAILGRITEAKWFTKMDLKHSFWLIPLHEDSRKYTGFMVNGVVYRFCVVPYGIQSACSALVKALHYVLDKYEDSVLHYIDDILIFSRNEEEHKKHIETVLRELDNAGLKINLKKCQFFKKEVVFLGYKLSETGVEMDEARMRSIMHYKRPTNLKTLRGFLGMVNYFKRLMPDLSEKTLVLMELLRKGVKWNWNEERESAFESLKSKFLENLKIYHPRYDIPFLLRTDASMNKFAGVLLQEREGKEVPIYFVSRITKSYEKNYNATELELASIIFCITKLRFYLLGAKFYVETDHAALTTIMNNRYANNRIHRWLLLLQEYNFEIKHIPGESNMIDALTREDGKVERENRKFKIGVNIIKEETGLYSKDEIIRDQRNLGVREKRRSQWKENVYIKEVEGREVYVVTRELGEKVLRDLHERYAHIGARKTWLIFRENYICQGDSAIIKFITRNCATCQKLKEKNRVNKNVVKSIVAENCLDMIAMDFLSELIPTNVGNKHILVIVDIFSKYVKLYACKRTNYNEISRRLTQYFEQIGKPKICILDNASYFQSDRFGQFCDRNGVKLNFTSIRHPAANPAERYIKEVVKFLRITCGRNHKIWDEKLEEIEHYINSVPNTNTEESPVYLLKGERPERKWEMEDYETYEDIKKKVKERVKRKAEKYIRKQESMYKKKVKFKRGDLVLVRKLRVSDRENQQCAKLQDKFEGPYEVANENPINSYLLKHPGTENVRGVFNIQDVYEYHQA